MQKKIIILVGGYGSGKTQVALNLAEKMQKTGEKISLIDLDIINPYFRSRELREELETKGIKFIGANENFLMSEAPALSPQIEGEIKFGQNKVLIDVGGDIGATVLGRFSESIKKSGYEMLLVVNVNRPFTADSSGIIDTAEFISQKSGLKITGLVNNTNLQLQTNIDNILEGQKIIEKASKKLQVPVKFLALEKAYLQEFREVLKGFEILPLNIYLRPSWMQRR